MDPTNSSAVWRHQVAHLVLELDGEVVHPFDRPAARGGGRRPVGALGGPANVQLSPHLCNEPAHLRHTTKSALGEQPSRASTAPFQGANGPCQRSPGVLPNVHVQVRVHACHTVPYPTPSLPTCVLSSVCRSACSSSTFFLRKSAGS